MVNGCEMFFSKEKMIQRITAEGRTDMIDEVVMSIMDNLDGQPVGTNLWQRQVYGKNVYSCIGKDGKCYDVNANDCV